MIDLRLSDLDIEFVQMKYHRNPSIDILYIPFITQRARTYYNWSYLEKIYPISKYGL
jgi:hypothetical protein